MFWLGELISRDTVCRSGGKSRQAAFDDAVLDRATAAYLGLAIGDALGATVEFMTPNEIAHKFGEHREITGGGWLRLRPGQVTDDTTMSLALGEAIVRQGGVTAASAAQAFDHWMRGKPVDIGNTVRRNLVRYRNTGETEALASEHDAGNGAAMRVLPVAIATFGRPDDEIAAASRAQAHVTHHNELSDAACETLIAMLHALFEGQPLIRHCRPLADALAERFPAFAYRKRRQENPGGFVAETLQAVFQALFETDGFEACLVEVVNRGGDADTTGAIAGMLAGACYGLDDIPLRWLRALDPAIRGRCTAQAEALFRAAGSN